MGGRIWSDTPTGSGIDPPLTATKKRNASPTLSKSGETLCPGIGMCQMLTETMGLICWTKGTLKQPAMEGIGTCPNTGKREKGVNPGCTVGTAL